MKCTTFLSTCKTIVPCYYNTIFSKYNFIALLTTHSDLGIGNFEIIIFHSSFSKSLDFSLEDWKASLDISMDTLLPTLSDQLMEHLGIAGYLSRPQCSLANGTTNGWIDGRGSETFRCTKIHVPCIAAIIFI